ncbi:MAG: PilZ domain-containing protein [Kofleriaceae bacterium]
MAKAKGAAQRRPRSARGTTDATSTSSRRRRHLVEVDVDYGSEDNYLFSYLTDSTTTGIFVRTLAPQPAGTHLSLRFAPAASDRADADESLEIEGEVIWVNPYRPSVKDNLHPGMGIRFVELDEATRRRLLALVGRFAYLT